MTGKPEVAVPSEMVAEDVVESVAEVVIGSTTSLDVVRGEELVVFTGSVVDAGSVAKGAEVVALALLTGAPDDAGPVTLGLGTGKPPEGAAGAPPAQ